MKQALKKYIEKTNTPTGNTFDGRFLRDKNKASDWEAEYLTLESLQYGWCPDQEKDDDFRRASRKWAETAVKSSWAGKENWKRVD